ncbi:MAG: hypothetical protein ACLTDF_03595 [Coprococcus sp.]
MHVCYSKLTSYSIVYRTLCTSEPELITGNNDDYRMGALAYKAITKGAVARYDNVLVTEPVSLRHFIRRQMITRRLLI